MAIASTSPGTGSSWARWARSGEPGRRPRWAEAVPWCGLASVTSRYTPAARPRRRSQARAIRPPAPCATTSTAAAPAGALAARGGVLEPDRQPVADRDHLPAAAAEPAPEPEAAERARAVGVDEQDGPRLARGERPGARAAQGEGKEQHAGEREHGLVRHACCAGDPARRFVFPGWAQRLGAGRGASECRLAASA